MDRREEDYFSTDAEDDVTTAPAGSCAAVEGEVSGSTMPAFTASEAPPPRPHSLVPYDEEDDDDEGLVFAPTAKRPKKMQIIIKGSQTVKTS